MYKLTDFLGLKSTRARNFQREIDMLESKISHGGSVSAKITAEIFENSHKILQELGFSGDDVLVEEVYSSLRNKFLGEQILEKPDDFWERYSESLILAKNGFVSANFDDMSRNIESGRNDNFENALAKIQDRIVDRYHERLPNFSKENIKKRLF